MKIKYGFWVLAWIWANPLAAQYEQILADPTVSWVAEIELTLTPDGNDHQWPYDSLNNTTVLKSVSTEPEDLPFRDPWPLMLHLFDAMDTDRKAMPTFADPGLTRPLTADQCRDQIYLIDTVVVFDPETFEEKILVASRCWGPSDLPMVKVRQLLIYREKTASFELITRAIAPVMPGGRTPIWLAVPSPKNKKAPSLADRDIIWARRLTTRGATPDMQELLALKNPGFPLLPNFLERARTDPKMSLLDPNSQPLPFEKRATLISPEKVDTIVTFDPETYVETVALVRTPRNLAGIRQLRLVEDWYWDQRRRQLIVRLVAVAPIVDVLDADGNLRYTGPLFYRKVE